MSELDRYLLRSERCLAQVRRHWAILVPQFSVVAAAWVVWFFLLNLSSSELLQTVGASFFVLSALWLSWLVFEWNCERFAVTDKRVLLVSGVITKRLAVMPLSKVTDMTYERSAAGRVLGYGTFIMESAGQDQALSRVDFVQYPEKLYFQLTEELFGQDDWASRDEIAPRPPSPPGRRAALRDEPRAAPRWPGWGWLGGRVRSGLRRRDRASSAPTGEPAPPGVGSPMDRSSTSVGAAGTRRQAQVRPSSGADPAPSPAPGGDRRPRVDSRPARPPAPAAGPRPPAPDANPRPGGPARADSAPHGPAGAAPNPAQRPLPWSPRRPPQEQPGEHTARLPQVRDPWAGPDK